MTRFFRRSFRRLQHRAGGALCALVLVLPLMNTAARAGGFQLNDHGARAVAMAFAVASGDGADASTIFFNPAGMTLLKDGFHITVGGAFLLPGAKFTGPTNTTKTTNMETWGFALPHLYAAYKVPGSDLAFGVGVFVPFGAGTLWNNDWSGRNLALRTYLQTITINPNVAYSLLDKKLSLAAGVTISEGSAQLRQRIINFGTEPYLNLTGSGWAFSFNAAAIYEPVQNLKIGVSYRHNINMKYDGQAKFSLDPEGNTPLSSGSGGLQNLFVDGPGGTALNLPFDLRTGISYRFDDNFMMEFGFDYVGWSSYDTLRINFNRAPAAPRKPDGSDNPGVVVNPRNYYNAPAVRLGAEYKASDAVKLRFGALFDAVPVDARYTQPILPDANRLGGSLGVGYKFSESFSVDVGYMFIYGLQRKVENSSFNFDGIYNSWANIASLSLHIKL